METKKDASYGVIPIKRFGDEWKVFLIRQYSRIGNNTYWILPKGHPEEGETIKETALRELMEETGMAPETLLAEPTFELKYKFKFGDNLIDKTVLFFVGVITQNEFKLDADEVVEAGWYTLPEAKERLDYKNAKDMFKKASTFIASYK
jgi:8-oxo-dGTP pyrophosphatase MutT (NUDIX family)